MKGKEKELECVGCGKIFNGVAAYFCKECRTKRRIAGLEKRTRHNMSEADREDDKESFKKLNEYREKIKKGIRFLHSDTCPNYDKESISCVICPAGAYKFKSCGK